MRPEQLIEAADHTTTWLERHVDADWSVRAGSLDWEVRTTVAHIAGGITKHVTYLASRATRWSPLVVAPHPEADNANLVDGVRIAAAAQAFVASQTSPEARGFHACGMDDASGFVARAVIEILVHGWDVLQGLGAGEGYDPPAALCAAAVARTYPWVVSDDPWSTLLEATGRLGSPEWRALDGPLEDWDGEPLTGPAPPLAIAWSWDEPTGRWLPTVPTDGAS